MVLAEGSHSKSYTVPSEGSATSTTEPKKSRKMYIPIKIQTNSIKKDDIAINATYISIEDLTSEEDRRKSRERARNVEVRYFDNIKSLHEKIKSSYSCNKEHCRAIKERMEQHQLQHHSSSSPLHGCHRQSQTTLKSLEPEHASVGTIHIHATAEPLIKRSGSISQKPSILKRAINPRHQNQSMQTAPKNMDLSHESQININNSLFKNDHMNLNYNYLDTNDFKPTEPKISFTSKNGVMKSDLSDEIMKWFEDIPVYPNLNPSDKNLRKNLINEFIEKIYMYTNEENTLDDYEFIVKKEIDSLLNALPMWYPGAKRDQDMLKDNIKNDLLVKIKDLRNKMYYEKTVDVQTDDTMNTYTKPNEFEKEKIAKLTENEILDWVMQIKFKESEDIGRTINLIDTTDIFARRLMPLLNRPACTRNYKLVLKSLILDTLNDLPHVFKCAKNRRLYLNRIAEELTNRLLYIQVKCRDLGSCSRFPRDRKMYRTMVCSNSNVKNLDGLGYCLGNLYPRFNVIEDVTEILVDFIDSIGFGDIGKRDEASEIRQISMESVETQASITVSDAVVGSVRNALTEDIINSAQYSNSSVNRPCLSSTVSVYKSEQNLFERSSGPVTSTPKRKKMNKKEIVKQNPEEISYTNKISEIIRTWMDTLPKNFNDDKKFKETTVMDLAGDIVDQLKTEQLVPINDADKNKMMYYTIFRWLYRFDIFEDEMSDDMPQIRDLQNRLSQISVPNLTRPRHGNRQAIASTKMKDSDRDFFVPKGMDVLEDEISIWMNEQPSDIYFKPDKDNRNTMIHELAKSVQNRLVNKSTEKEINNDIVSWLKKVLKSSKKKNIDKLSEDLKNRLLKVPQDKTLTDNLHKKIEGKLQAEAARNNPQQAPVANDSIQAQPDVDPDKTLKEFIVKYMEHNYDVDDTVARGAFGELLKTEIRKLNPPTRKEVYDNFTKPREVFSPDRLDKELQYIKIVSDWLKNIPLDSSFNVPHNKQRIEIVNDLARNIYEVEEERRRAPTAMDYEMYLASIISQFTNLLPIPPQHQGNVMFMIEELIGRVIADRTPMPCCQNKNQTQSSFNTTGIPEQNISEFIHNYIHLNAGEFADDQMKMDAWSSRLMKEVKKIVQTTADPSTLCKTQVYSKLMNVPIPEDESVRLFGLELGYAKEISDWLKNMPLLHLQTQEAKDERVKMISELAEKFSERDRKRITNPSESDNNAEIEEYITHWIQRIPLEPNKDIDIPILIKQLLRRIERVNKDTEVNNLLVPENKTDKQCPTKSKRSNSKLNKPKSKTQRCRSCCRSGKGHAGQVVVEAIENWSKSLPVKSDSKDTDKTIKDDIARKLYQTVGNLSVDRQIMNDDELFQELLTDEVNTVLNNLPQNPDIQKKKESLKNDLVEKVMEAKSIVNEAVAGQNYKLQLENTIEASIPTPKTNKQWYDPGFEIYKNRLADMFILDNFDHGNDAVKIKYERKIRDEVDKYFESAQKRNAVPLDKDEIYNELYSALFKVPVPNEASAMAEVEEVKTRCVIDMWFDELPLREASDLNELLEWDKILAMLAKRLHEIETNEQNPNDKMRKEVAKWITKFPLVQGQESNVEKFIDDLLDRLKTSKENRKCVTVSAKGKEIQKGPKQKLSRGNKSQVAGPSSEGQKWKTPTTQSQPCCQVLAVPRKKPAELVLEIVEIWCDQLPLPVSNPHDEINNKIIRDNLLTQIIIKICALNGNPQTFNDTILYEHFLDIELEHLLSEVPICCQFEQTKNAKKKQLVEDIIALLPLMREDRACYEYKQELKTTINKVLEEPLDTTAEKLAEFNQLKEEIVDNFVQYHYNRDDDEGKQVYKANLHEIVSKYLQDIRDKTDDSPVDPLMRQNQLLCELAKVPIPCERVIKDEVEEIRMKDEVKDFFDKLALPDVTEDKMTLRKNIKVSLAKRLYDIEKTGHNCDNDAKMKKEIKRCLKKIDIEVSPEKIDTFVDKLKSNEAARKAPPIENKAIVPPQKISSVKEPNVGQVCGLKQCIGDRKSLETPQSQHQDLGGEIPMSSPIFSMPQRNNVSTTGPSVSQTPQSQEDPSNQPQRFARGQMRNQRGQISDEEADDDTCKCQRRMRRRFRGRPRCVLRLEDYCDECEQFRHMYMPMPYRMPPPRYYYY